MQVEKKTSRKSTIQPNSRSNLENSQYWLRKTQSKSGINSLPKEVAVGQGRQKTLNLMGSQCLCCDKIGVKCWGAEKIGLLISLGNKSKSFRDMVPLEQGLKG